MPRFRFSLFQRLALVVSTILTANLLAAPSGGITTFPGVAEFSPQLGVPSPATQVYRGFKFTSVSTGTVNLQHSTDRVDGTLTLRVANATGLSPTLSTTLPYSAVVSYRMDKTPPTVVSVERLTPLSQTTGLANVTFKLTYSEDVHRFDPQISHFAVSVVNGSTSVTGSEAIRYVTVNIQSGSGEFRLFVLD